ncbi:DUF6273 domain-containing protein [Holdemanella sp.]|uniref:DUF6273 domain-containing protein n=1 Tax=Holdemanella sp. TaxID=1971762 RepID=UPI00307FE4D1
MKKFITLCGFLVLGSIACGDVDVVKAEAINEQTTDTSGYTITIPSDVDIDKDNGKGSFAVTGKMDAQTELDVSVSSQNGYKLKNKNQEISYSLDKGSFHVNNIKSADMKSFDENFNISLVNTNTNYSGNYEDRLTFNIQCHKYTYELDMNSILDGVRECERHNYGVADVYINGVLKAENVSDFKEILNYGDTYEFKNIKATDGHHFVGINSCANTSIKGRVGTDTNYLETRRDNPYNLVAPIYFEFNTNKLTINYHADGAQTWLHFDNITYDDVSGKDTAESEIHLYDKNYSAKYGLGDVSRLKKNGHTAKPNTWVVGKNGTKEVIDTTGLAKSQDVADYCGVLDEFKKDDTTIDLYPIWTANTYTLTVNPNGGLINGDGSSKVLDTKLCFDTGNCCDINYLKPTRKGFEFLGWYDAPENGNIVYDSNGKCINNGNYWKDSSYVNPNNLTVYAQWKKVSYSAGTVLNIEGSDYIVMSQTDDDTYLVIDGESIGNMQYQPNIDADGNYKVGTYEVPNETRHDGQYSNTYEGSYIDNYLESTWYKQLPDKLQKAIQATDIKQVAYNNTSSNPKWRWSGTDWYYNEGTTENPKWVIYNKANIPDDAQGAYPLNCWKYSEKGYNNTTYNTISRHVFLPSVEEVSNLVDLNNANKVYNFLKGTNNSLYHMWFRDSNSSSPRSTVYLIYADRSMDSSTGYVTYHWVGVRPAFAIDLSKIDYTVTGSVNYK